MATSWVRSPAAAGMSWGKRLHNAAGGDSPPVVQGVSSGAVPGVSRPTQPQTPGSRMAPRRRLLALLLLLGCGHSEPFTNPDTSTDQPFDPGPPVRLTANPGGDLQPAWTADGSGLLYSVSDPARQDRDVCLALIPAGGARQSEQWCDVPEGFRRSDAVFAAGPGPDGRTAFLASATGLTNFNPEHTGLRVAPGPFPRYGTEVVVLPYARGIVLV